MEEIKVDEYVRTKEGQIIKVREKTIIFNDDDGLFIDEYMLPYEQKVVKHSSNIIDLIEVGDYVNGERVMCFRNTDNCDYDIGTEYSDDFGEYFGLNKEDIKSIVTKEAFASVEYRIGENNE